MAVTLAQDQIARVVNQGWYVFEVTPNTTDSAGLGLSGFYGNGCLYTGEGSITLAYLQKQLVNWPKATLKLDVPVAPIPFQSEGRSPVSRDSFNEGAIEGPALQAGASFIDVTLDDVEALRLAFIVRWGDIVKPSVYAIGLKAPSGVM